MIGEDLDDQHRAELEELLEESRDVLQNEPGRTSWTEHYTLMLREQGWLGSHHITFLMHTGRWCKRSWLKWRRKA